MLPRLRLIAALLTVTLSALAGCSTPLRGVRMPEGFRIERIAGSDAGTPFDVSRGGAFASVSDGSIVITDRRGDSFGIDRSPATALCFSPAGERLAAALPSGNATALRLFDAKGKVLGETKIPGRVTSLAWRSGEELLAGAVSIRKFTFGSELKSRLYQWNGADAPVATTLTDVTLRPQVAKMPEETLYNQLIIAVSPYGDEIAYSSLKDPPLFVPYLKVSVRHLETGAEIEVAKTSLGAGKVLYTPDGESLVVGDLNGARRVSIPDGKEIETWHFPGRSPAISPSGEYLFLDGRLYRDGKAVADFPAGERGIFLPDGSGLALSHQGKLYLVSGMKEGPAPVPPSDPDRLLKLRRLRSQGLITESEYRREKDKGLIP